MICPSCQTANPDAARFCLNCGTAIETAPVVTGERRMVTVLFADVVGSTSMAEHLDPEVVTEIMNGAFGFLNDAVNRYGGTVARLMGDAIMAFFGAPVAHENDAERAIRAGIDIQHAAAEYGQMIQRRYGESFNIRAGVNTGLVVIATVGDQIRSEYTVMGDTVNVASRLQSAADPGSILISGETWRLVRHLVDAVPRGPAYLKGKSSPVDTWEIMGLKAIPETGRGLEGITSALVGRDQEVAFLDERLARATEGHGSATLIIGEAGIGKSRLIAELRRRTTSLDGPELIWIEGRALSFGTHSYFLWRDALSQAINAAPGDEPDVVREKLYQTSERLHVPQDELPFLEAILSVETEYSREILADNDGSRRARRITSAVGKILEQMANHAPVVLVFDDLHWADTASLNLIQSLLPQTKICPLAFVMLLRPEKGTAAWEFVEQSATVTNTEIPQIWLEPLAPDHARALLRNLLFIEDLPLGVRDLILSKSEGNPFFLEEVIRSLIDSGHIVRHNDHWRATADIVDVRVPDTLVGVLSARIDRLPAETKRVAQNASIIGRIFNYPVLKAVCEAAPPEERVPEPLPHLTRLTYEELVRERAKDPELEYIFKHVLTQEAAYNLLLVRTRREYHLRAATVLESLYADRLDEFSGALAYHFWQGESWQKAMEYSLRAGTRAEMQLYALAEAHNHFERAWDAVQRIPDATPAQICDVVIAGTSAALKMMPHDRLLERLHAAEQIARDAGDKLRLSKILNWIAHLHVWDGFSARAMPAMFEAADLSKELGDERLRVYPTWVMAESLVDSNPKAALGRLGEVVELARRARNSEIEVHTLGGIAMTYARLGEFPKALEYLNQAHNRMMDIDAPVTVGDIYLMTAAVFFDMGDIERGMRYGELGTRIELDHQAMECASAGYCIIGNGQLAQQRITDALDAFRQSKEIAESITIGAHVHPSINAIQRLKNQVSAGLAISNFATGNDGAIDEMLQAAMQAESQDDLYTGAMVRLAMSDAYASQGKLTEAEQQLANALDYYQRNEMQPYLARALDQRAALRDQMGNHGDATADRQQAEAIRNTLQVPAVDTEFPLHPIAIAALANHPIAGLAA